MRASILAVGDELTLGQNVDTNSAWLSKQLVAESVYPVEHRTVPDDRAAMTAAIDDLAERSDLLLITGGLGPTEDDLTRAALGDAFTPGQDLVRDDDAVAAILRWFDGRGSTMPPSNLVQADRPSAMISIPNPVGTAPGLRGEYRGCLVFAIPGPPYEMRRMFERAVRPALPPPGERDRLLTETVHLYGLGESVAAERLGDLTSRDRNPVVGTTAGAGVITARILARGEDTVAEEALHRTAEQIEALWAPYCFGRGAVTLAQATGDALRDAGATLATAESCTGGQLGAAIVDVAGASEYYRGGWVTYANEMKTSCLGVDAELLRAHGAVSTPVARAMAEGALRVSGADYALSVTGVAGPGAGGPEKPAGLVFVGLAASPASTGDAASVCVREFRFRGDRGSVRDRTVKSALQMLRLAIGGHRDAPLIWERSSEVDAREENGS